MAVDLTGSYLTLDDGRPAVRFSRAYDHPAERVWHFVTDPGELARWFPCRAEPELRPGGTVRFGDDPGLPPGRVLAVDPPRRLSFSWGGDELRFALDPAGTDRTRLTFTDVLDTPEAAARNGAGWEVCLAALDALARGEHPAGPPAGPTPLWRAYYEGYLAAGVPSGAPVPGLDRP
ncbi:SRPBCC family protein [Streptomyces sp. F-1]|uniref:SRPBCC family protein n=1 Tax=Streptomyces sp. F-1 TaxID=463642 RepID=UPI00085BD5FE|nr:SRPBCC family protein [Streptomyces sp. F-1]SFY48514.1 hypothetical protein STEPF1_01739 [Streptomyces sp. F-1]